MQNAVWERMRLSPAPPESELWELFHENSKTGRYDRPPTPEAVLQRMEQTYQTLPYDGCPRLSLPGDTTLPSAPLGTTLTRRVTARPLAHTPVTLPELTALLRGCYGVTRRNLDNGMPRPFRAAPSGGALYPLELYLHADGVPGVEPGLYHFDPLEDALAFLRPGAVREDLAQALVQSELAAQATILFFHTAVFARSTFKYGDRGYRFVLLEAGHVAQNLNLIAAALGLGCVNVGGFYDRDVDRWLGLDGVTQSTVYMTAVSGAAAVAKDPVA